MKPRLYIITFALPETDSGSDVSEGIVTECSNGVLILHSDFIFIDIKE